jgi:hypothetical protein
MDPDTRLRARLARLAGTAEPDLEQRFEAVVNAADRRRRDAPIGGAIRNLAVAATLLIVVMIGFVGRGTSPAAPRQLDSTSWTATLRVEDAAVAREGLAGAWILSLPASGAVELVGPPTYLAPTTGYRFQVQGDRITIGLFVERCSGVDPGVYRFEIVGETLTFTLVDDACPHRTTLLTASPWRAASAP